MRTVRSVRFDSSELALVSLFAAVATCLPLAGCGPSEPQTLEGPVAVEVSDEELRARAEALAEELLLVDTHVDVPYRLQEKMEDISVRTEGGDFDWERAKAGGLNAPFMSIYIPASYQTEGGAKGFADSLIDMVEGFETAAPEKFAVAHSPEDLLRHKERGLVSLPMGMENGAGIEDDLANLEHFFDRGIRYITLTHSANNLICDSSYAEEREWNGLSPFGRTVVEEMNRLGIMVDVSHVSDDTFYQVMEISKAPAIASHSSCRMFTPGWERNMDDAMIQKLAEKGGVIHINFGSAFLTEEAKKQGDAFWPAMQAFAQESGAAPGSPEMEAWLEEYWKDKEKAFADVTDVVAHIDHVVDLTGIDHVGLGSDFDGVGDSLPTGLKDVSSYPNLLFHLLKAGYSEEDLRKICGGNLLRVWNEVNRVAAELRAAGGA